MQIIYMSPDDPKMMDEWVSCNKCCNWYHESCAELNGVFDEENCYVCICC